MKNMKSYTAIIGLSLVGLLGTLPHASALPGLPPPTITCPPGVMAECTGTLTPVTYTVTATDSSGNPLSVTCVPPSGTGFRVGTSNVVCSATDASGGRSSCSFTVTVADTTPPTTACNSNITANATSPAGAVVTYVAGASDACGIASFNCVPPSGSTFPVGTTTVTCRAEDNAGLSASCTFTITVNLVSPNQPPVCDLQVPCNGSVIALNGSNACVVLDGSGSTDPDGDALTYSWTLNNVFNVSLDGAQDGGGARMGSGTGTVTLSGNTLTINIAFSGLSAPATASHIHGPAMPGVNAAVLYPLTAITTPGIAGTINGTVGLVDGTGGFTRAQQLQQLRGGLWYINIHNTNFPGGEIRGQLPASPSASGAIVTNCFAVGCHTVTLTVSDGQATSQCQTNLCVVSPCDAVDECIALVDASTV